MQYLNMFLTFINSNVKNVNLFGKLEKLCYFCGVRKYKKKESDYLTLNQWLCAILV
jgi:hypothetical protein